MENKRGERQLATKTESDDDIPDIDYSDPVHMTPRPSMLRGTLSHPSYDSLIRKESISRLNEDLFSLVKGEEVALDGFSTDSNSSENDNKHNEKTLK